MALMVVYSEKYMHWAFPWIDMAKITAATGATGGALFFLNKIHIHGAGGLVLIVVAGTVVFFGVLLLVRGVTVIELEFAWSMVRRLPFVGRFTGGSQPPEE